MNYFNVYKYLHTVKKNKQSYRKIQCSKIHYLKLLITTICVLMLAKKLYECTIYSQIKYASILL